MIISSELTRNTKLNFKSLIIFEIIFTVSTIIIDYYNMRDLIWCNISSAGEFKSEGVEGAEM